MVTTIFTYAPPWLPVSRQKEGNKHMDKHIKADGSTVDVTPRSGTGYSLDELKGFVGGWIEIVPLRGGKIMVVNEEGLLMGLPVNETASLLARQTIVGDVLVCASERVK